jgi:hypothetical protein
MAEGARIWSTLVGVYWRRRADAFDECAARLARHFEALATASEGLARWYEQARRKPKVPREVPVRDRVALADLLSKGVNRTDIGRNPIPDLGWLVMLWNGDRGRLSASTSVHCGCTTLHVGNAALLKVSSEDREALSRAPAVELLKALVEIWQPDSGVVSNSVLDLETDETATANAAVWTRSRWTHFLSRGVTPYGGGFLREIP